MVWQNSNPKTGRSDPSIPQHSNVIVYGTSWCGMSQIVRRYLDRTHIDYEYIDLDNNPGAISSLKWVTGGYARHPTVVIDGQVLIEPTIDELENTLIGGGYLEGDK